MLPGDELLPDPGLVTTRATTIVAPAAAIWPWLVQMGYQRGGWYSIDRFEQLIGAGDFLTGGSAERVVPELQSLAVGDPVPLSATRALVVRHLDAPHALVLELPESPLAWVWSFTLHPVEVPAGAARSDSSGAARSDPSGAARSDPCSALGTAASSATRLVIRTRAGARSGWVRPLLAPLDAGHLVMEAVQLQRLRRRAEGGPGSDPGASHQTSPRPGTLATMSSTTRCSPSLGRLRLGASVRSPMTRPGPG